jgi:hypothetical protein
LIRFNCSGFRKTHESEDIVELELFDSEARSSGELVEVFCFFDGPAELRVFLFALGLGCRGEVVCTQFEAFNIVTGRGPVVKKFLMTN